MTSSAYLSIYNIYVWTRQHQTGLSYQSSCERSDGRLASPGPVASRTQQVLSSNLIRNKFQAAKRKKNPLAVLAARLGPHGHEPGFGGFSTRLSRLGFLLMKKRWGRFTPRVEFFFISVVVNKNINNLPQFLHVKTQ